MQTINLLHGIGRARNGNVMQSAYGLKGTIEKVRNANGPAQHIACSITGLIIAGMFAGMVHPVIISTWAGLSVLVIVATIWLKRVHLKYVLLADFVLSMVVMFQYLMYEEPMPIQPVYYTMTANGMSSAARPMMDMAMTSIETVAHVAAVIWLSVWSLYLANLVHRQILERKRVLNEY